MHSVGLIEHLSAEKVTKDNAEDITCKAIRSTLDLVRHFTVPNDLEEKIVEDEDGFVYKEEWWIKAFIGRPAKAIIQAKELMKKVTEKIYKCLVQPQRFIPRSLSKMLWPCMRLQKLYILKTNQFASVKD